MTRKGRASPVAPAPVEPPALSPGEPVRARGLVIFLLAVVALGMVLGIFPWIARGSGRDNLHVLQAEAFLARRLDVDPPPDLLDVAVYAGKSWVVFPPAPAIVLVPIVAALGGAHADTTLVALVLTGLAVFALSRALGRLGLLGDERILLLLAFFAGTPYWFALQESRSVWHFSHVVAATAVLFAVAEVLGRARPLLVGALLGAALLSRQFSLLLAPFFAVQLLEPPAGGGERRPLRSLAPFAAALAVALSGYLVFNALRFGSPFEPGYRFIRLTNFLKDRLADYGLFSPAYVPFNLLHLFVQGFHLEWGDRDALAQTVTYPFGSSLLSASPFCLLALFADRRERRVRTAWGSVALIALLACFYYNNGWVQPVGQRFTLDFWPVLVVLVALGLKRGLAEGSPPPFWKAAVAWSVTLNVVAVSLLPLLNRFLESWERLWK